LLQERDQGKGGGLHREGERVNATTEPCARAVEGDEINNTTGGECKKGMNSLKKILQKGKKGELKHTSPKKKRKKKRRTATN